MEQKNNIGRMKCAICGISAWVRENKNGILYSNCINHHQTKLNGDDSISAKNALKQGKSWNNGLIFIYPNERANNDGNNTIGTAGTNTRTELDGRANGQLTTTTSRGTESNTDTSDRLGIGCW